LYHTAWCSYRAKLYFVKFEKDLQVELLKPEPCYDLFDGQIRHSIGVHPEKDLQVELLKPEPCYDLSDGHDVGILLPHTGEHHQGQLDVECAQALQKMIPTLGSGFDFLTNNKFSTLLCKFHCEAII
jgi:hypothetical protein